MAPCLWSVWRERAGPPLVSAGCLPGAGWPGRGPRSAVPPRPSFRSPLAASFPSTGLRSAFTSCLAAQHLPHDTHILRSGATTCCQWPIASPFRLSLILRTGLHLSDDQSASRPRLLGLAAQHLPDVTIGTSCEAAPSVRGHPSGLGDALRSRPFDDTGLHAAPAGRRVTRPIRPGAAPLLVRPARLTRRCARQRRTLL